MFLHLFFIKFHYHITLLGRMNFKLLNINTIIAGLEYHFTFRTEGEIIIYFKYKKPIILFKTKSPLQAEHQIFNTSLLIIWLNPANKKNVSTVGQYILHGESCG